MLPGIFVRSIDLEPLQASVKGRSPRIWLTLRLIVAAVCFVSIWKVWPSDPSLFNQVWHAPWYLLLAILLRPVFTLLLGLRASVLLRPLWPGLRGGELIRMAYLGQMFNQFLPGGIGGDLARATLLQHATAGSWTQIAGGLALDRIIGLVMLLLLASVTAGGALTAAVGWPGWTLAAGAILGLGVVAAVVRSIPREWLWRRRFWIDLAGSWRALTVSTILSGAALALVGHACLLVSCGLMFDAAGWPVPWSARIAVLCVSFVLAVLPVSVGGHGIREGALVWLLTSPDWNGSPALLPTDRAVVLAMSLLLVHVVTNVTCGLIVGWVWRNPRR